MAIRHKIKKGIEVTVKDLHDSIHMSCVQVETQVSLHSADLKAEHLKEDRITLNL